MCGIFGFLAGNAFRSEDIRKKYTGYMADAAITSSVRGMNGAGIFSVRRNDGGAELLKRPLAPWHFLEMGKTQNFLAASGSYNGMIGHVRAPTRGQDSYANTHPFAHDNVLMVHNGTLNSVTSLGLTWEFGTDSEHITKALSAADDPEKVLSKLDGAFALAWYDGRTQSFYLSRNDKRELHFAECKEHDTILIASEWKMLEWLADRNGIAIGKTYQVEPETYIRFPRKEPLKMEILKFKEYKAPTKVWTSDELWPDHKKNVTNVHRIPKKEDNATKLRYTVDPAEIAKHGLTVGQEITLNPTRMYLNKKSSKSGIMVGIMKESPWCWVRALGVDVRKVFNTETKPLIGKVLGILRPGDSNFIVVVRDIVVDRNAEVPQHKSATVIVGPVELFDRGLEDKMLNPVNQLTNHKKDDEDEKEEAVAKGPGGRLVTEKAWNYLTKTGCAFCSGDLPFANADTVFWIQDSPVCSACANEGTTVPTVNSPTIN